MNRADVRAMLWGGGAGLVAVSLVTCAEIEAPKTVVTPDSDPPVQPHVGNVDQTLMWVDATGRDITPVAGNQEFLRTVTADGLVWQVSPRTGTVSELVALALHSDDGCGGMVAVDTGRQPRRAFRVAGQDGWFSAPDDEYAVAMAPDSFTYSSYRDSDGDCVETELVVSGSWLVRLEDLLVHPDAEPPAVDFEPPLHIEER